MKVLSIQSSASMDFSLTRKMSRQFLNCLERSHSEASVKELDLVKNPPPFMSQEWIAGAFSKGDLCKEQVIALRKSDEYIEDIKEADVLVIGAPMYNYGMPAALKAWFDQVARVNKTFSFDLSRGDQPIEPILEGKRLVLFTSSGEFDFQKGGTREAKNHLVPHIIACAHYLGVNNSKDIFHIGIEYQEFRDARHEASKNLASERIPEVLAWLGKSGG